MDEFVEIEGTNGRHKINRLGVITGRQRKVNRRKCHKYPVAKLEINGKLQLYKLHRLIAKAFIPNPHNYIEVNHINGIKSDYRVENLEWCSPKMNMAHAVATGLLKHKLSKTQVEEIKKLHQEGKPKQELARRFNVHRSTISRVVNGVTSCYGPFNG